MPSHHLMSRQTKNITSVSVRNSNFIGADKKNNNEIILYYLRFLLLLRIETEIY